jgi:hypothetical protein
MYIIQPWHNVVLLLVAVLLHLPFLIDDLVHPSFQVHPTGAVVITGAFDPACSFSGAMIPHEREQGEASTMVVALISHH